MFAPVGCAVEVLNSIVTSSSIIQSWDGSTATLYPGFPKYDIDENNIQNGYATAYHSFSDKVFWVGEDISNSFP